MGLIDCGLYDTDPPYWVFGVPKPPIERIWNPMWDVSLSLERRADMFPLWVSGYYKHGKLPLEVEMRTPLEEPRPTLATMTDEEVKSSIYPPPGNPGGSDETLYSQTSVCEMAYLQSRCTMTFVPNKRSRVDLTSVIFVL